MSTEKKLDIQEIALSMDQLWSHLTDEQRQLMARRIVVRQYQKNEIIYYEQEEPVHLFCLLKGKVRICKEGVGGRQQIVRMVSPKGFFGYRAGFVSGKYLTEGSAIEDTTLCLIPLPLIKQIIEENHQVAIYFIKQLASLLGSADESMVNLTQKHLRGRLAEALLRLKDSYGTEENLQTLAVTLSREDLANLSNMTTSNAIRTLSSFANDGLIAIEGRKISLKNEAELRKISQNG